MSASVALSRGKWSIGTRCQGYIGDTFGYHAKDLDSIPSKDPYEEVARQLLEQAPRSPEYVPDPIELKDHVPVYIPEPEHPEDLVLAEDEAPIEAYITEVASAPPPPPSFLPSLIRPPHTRAAMAQMRAATPSTYHPLLPSGTPQLLPIPLPTPSISRRANIPEADMPPRKRLLLTAPRLGCEVPRYREEDDGRLRDGQLEGQLLAMRAEIEVLRRERLAYEQESMETRQALARFKAYSRALKARVTVLETQARRHEWQRQDTDDHATRHIMRIQALEARARDDTLEDSTHKTKKKIMSSYHIIVQDIRHKFRLFYFSIKGSLLFTYLTIYMHHLRGSVYRLLICTRPLLDDYKKGKKIHDLQLFIMVAYKGLNNLSLNDLRNVWFPQLVSEPRGSRSRIYKGVVWILDHDWLCATRSMIGSFAVGEYGVPTKSLLRFGSHSLKQQFYFFVRLDFHSDEDLMNLAKVYDLPYDAYYVNLLSLEGVTLLCSVSHYRE
ncbi:hypothetical protein Tco_0887972 [Tanacetum coccineum]